MKFELPPPVITATNQPLEPPIAPSAMQDRKPPSAFGGGGKYVPPHLRTKAINNLAGAFATPSPPASPAIINRSFDRLGFGRNVDGGQNQTPYDDSSPQINSSINSSNGDGSPDGGSSGGIFELSLEGEDDFSKLRINTGVGPPELRRHRTMTEDEEEDILVGAAIGFGGCGFHPSEALSGPNGRRDVPKQQTYHYHTQNNQIVGNEDLGVFEVTALSSVGGRSNNEDAFVVVPDLMQYHGVNAIFDGGAKLRMAAVLDGHLGSAAAEFAVGRIGDLLAENIVQASDGEVVDRVKSAIVSSLKQIDDEYLKMDEDADDDKYDCGCTCICVVIVDYEEGGRRSVVVGNIGDCEGVMGCTQGQDDEVEIAVPHNPTTNEVERDRILNRAGGWLDPESDGFSVKQSLIGRILEDEDFYSSEGGPGGANGGGHDSKMQGGNVGDVIRDLLSRRGTKTETTITRVCGELAVSRSIGDRLFKAPRSKSVMLGENGIYAGPDFLPYPLNHPQTFGPDDLVSSECDITSFDLPPAEEGEVS